MLSLNLHATSSRRSGRRSTYCIKLFQSIPAQLTKQIDMKKSREFREYLPDVLCTGIGGENPQKPARASSCLLELAVRLQQIDSACSVGRGVTLRYVEDPPCIFFW